MSERLKTGANFLDAMLKGGYDADAVTTIYGPPGSGKTNFAILAAVEVAKKGKKVIYIDTEGGFSIERLKQITDEEVMDNVIFLNPVSFEEQKHAIGQLRELASQRVGLVIVDTISMLYRLQRGDEEYFNKEHKELSSQMRLLNEVARTKKIPVLLISQIYQGFEGQVKIVGGDIINYTSKILLELSTRITGTRVVKLKKHRSQKSGEEKKFKIVEKGVEEIIPQQNHQVQNQVPELH